MMKKIQFFILILLLAFLVSCGKPSVTPTPAPSATPTETLQPPSVQTTSVPDPTATARAYLDAWKAEDYPAMYAKLTPISKDAITEEDFTKFYRDVAAEAALSGWDYEVRQNIIHPRSAQVAYNVILHSTLVGDLTRDTQMNLSFENGQWQVQWDEALLMPELKGGNKLRMEYQSPSRANIYDRSGHALVAQSDAVAIGLDTGQVGESTQNALLTAIYRLTGVRPEKLRDKIDAYRQNGWYLPVADVSAEDWEKLGGAVSQFSGVIAQPFRARYYFNGGIAPHVVGYVSAIQQEEVEEYKRLGYNVWSDRVGQKGLEAWGEKYLAGKRGGTLYLIGPDGATITRLAETSPEPSQAIYTTLDKDLQKGAQDALGDFRGAIVVLERDTGRVLAMASSPEYNPNLFEPQNANYSYQINDLFDQEKLPLLNRAAQGQYPLGSVFKLITFSAALKSGEFTPESEYNCEYFFRELQGVELHDWTYDHFLKDGKTQASGILTLPQGLMRSCNPWFWHIGLTLFNDGLTTDVSQMARAFGLGSPTGIEIPEEAGQIPDPSSQVDSTNLAIGQGGTLVTPLQVADFIAAIGNGGTLYTPKVVEKIVATDGTVTDQFTPTVRGTLPITGTMLQTLQDAMVSVVKNPRGTAYYVLNPFTISYKIPIAGKTGTAESGSGDPHAWFAGYTSAEKEDKPDIAVVVLVENGGEGSEIAAPIFRRVLETYFLGKPQVKYPWESSIGVVPTPTPQPTETPVPGTAPEETPTPSP
jgi:cell division protein FtsI/penicillin-binding protein 2